MDTNFSKRGMFYIQGEFCATALGIRGLLWLRLILSSLEIDIDRLMMLCCGNKAAIDMSHNPI